MHNNATHSLCVADPPTVIAVAPVSGPQDGSTLLTVTGTEFLPRVSLTCQFGTMRSAATYATPSRLTCLSPAASGAGDVSFAVSNNNQDFTADAVAFTYDGMLGCG